MFKRYRRAFILALAAMLIVAAPVLAAYSAPFTIIEDDGIDYDMLAIIGDSPNEFMAENGFMNASANDTRVETLGGLEQPHLVADNKTLTAVPVPANSQTNLYFTTGSSELTRMNLITGRDGYIYKTDNASTEPGNDFTLTQNVYLDTSVNPYYTTSRPQLNFVNANNDYVVIPDDNVFSFTDGAGNDLPFTIEIWLRLDEATSLTWLSKILAAGNKYEWGISTTAGDLLGIYVYDPTGVNYRGRVTNAITGHEGTLVCYTFTYDGSETCAGFNIYINAVDSDTADVTNGAYAGMTNNDAAVNLGSYGGGAGAFLDGSVVDLKIWRDRELTPAEVLASYNGELSIPGLAAWYPMLEGNGLPNDIAGGHDATSNLADWVSGNGPMRPVLAGKAGAYMLFPNGSGNLTYVGGGNVTGSGILNGERTIVIDNDAGGLELLVDAVSYDTSNQVTVGNTANRTVFWQGNVAPYGDNITLDVSGVLQLWYEPTSMIMGTFLPDRAVGNSGVIVWGENPTGVNATMHSMVSSGQPDIGYIPSDVPRDILPSGNSSDWFGDGTVTKAATLANPFRPFITMVSDNTTLSEIQVWRWLGVALWLLVTVATAKSVRHHQGVTAIVAGVCLGGLVAFDNNIFPLWLLIVTVGLLVGGIVAERSPSL